MPNQAHAVSARLLSSPARVSCMLEAMVSGWRRAWGLTSHPKGPQLHHTFDEVRQSLI